MSGKNKSNTNFIHSGSGTLTFTQAQYYGYKYHHLPVTDDGKFARYVYQFAKSKFHSWIARMYDAFPKPLVNLGYSFFGDKDYTGHFMINRTFTNDVVEQAIKDGAAQVVVFVNGFSSFATVHHKEYPSVQFFEVSHGESYEVVQAALKALQDNKFQNKATREAAKGLQSYGTSRMNMHYIDGDITKGNWPVLLMDQDFDPTRKTIFIARGLTVYLSAEETNNFIKNVKSLMSVNSTAILDFAPPALKGVKMKANLKACDSVGAHYNTCVTAADAPQFLFDRGLYALEQLPNTTIYTSLGFTEKQADNNALRQNTFVVRAKAAGDEFRPLAEIPAIKVVDWKGEKALKPSV